MNIMEKSKHGIVSLKDSSEVVIDFDHHIWKNKQYLVERLKKSSCGFRTLNDIKLDN